MTLRRWGLALAVAVLMAACGGQGGAAGSAEEAAADESPATGEAEAAEEPATTEEAAGAEEETTDAQTATQEAAVTVTSTDLGEILADGQGRVVYVFDNDTGGESACYDDCAVNWPPLPGPASAGEGVDEALLGTTERTDGTTQVTYGERPLYYFSGDQQPGDTNGQAVGDVWWVVGADGEAIEAAASAAAAATGEDY